MSWRQRNSYDASSENSPAKYGKKKQKNNSRNQRDELVESCTNSSEQPEQRIPENQNHANNGFERKKQSRPRFRNRKKQNGDFGNNTHHQGGPEEREVEPIAGPSPQQLEQEPIAGPSHQQFAQEPIAGPSHWQPEEQPIAGPSHGFSDYFRGPWSSNSFRRPESQVSSRTGAGSRLENQVAGGANGIFTRRMDFSSFNTLPKLKLNSYQIKTEDEGNHGNDDTRCFILSTLASHNRSKVQCVLCEEYLLVFDRYPLVDGTFFLSPRQHAKCCIEVKVEGRTQFLACVCMGCLEGVSGKQVFCRYCNTRWDGSSLVLGTMYSYDIFAAMPCCTERIKCNSCLKPVLSPAQRLNYFSDYSHMVPCPHCRTLDTHFVKSLPYCFVQLPLRTFSQWP